MTITELELREHYALLETEQLAELQGSGTLTDLARGVLEQVLKERGIADGTTERASTTAQKQLEEEQTIDSMAAGDSHLVDPIIDTTIAHAHEGVGENILMFIGLLRLLQALVLKFFPLYFAGSAVAFYWPNQNALAFVCLAWAWWHFGSKFRGVRGVRWRAWRSALIFCTVMFVSGFIFIDVWHLSWAGLWIFLLTGAAMAAVYGEESKVADVNT